MATLTLHCPGEACFAPNRVEVPPWPAVLVCRTCGREERFVSSVPEREGPSPCAVCGCAALYAQADLDQRFGCVVLGVGIGVALLLWWLVSVYLFVPTLLAVWLLDRALRRVVPPVVICYRCDAEYRGFADVASFRAWDAHVGERYSEGRFERGKR